MTRHVDFKNCINLLYIQFNEKANMYCCVISISALVFCLSFHPKCDRNLSRKLLSVVNLNMLKLFFLLEMDACNSQLKTCKEQLMTADPRICTLLS